MTVPAGPFAGRLLTEIARVKAGLPGAAAEIGVEPRVIDEIASGATPAADDLDLIYRWLSDRVRLSPEELADYHRMGAAAWSRNTVAVPDQSTRGSGGRGVPPTPPKTGLPVPRTVGTVVIVTVGVIVVILLAVLITLTVAKPQDTQAAGSSGEANSPTAKAAETADTGSSATTHSPAASAAASSASPTATLPTPAGSAAGEQINAYSNLELSDGYGFNFAAGPPPRPQADEFSPDGGGSASQDLWYSVSDGNGDSDVFGTDTGTLSVPVGSQAATFTNCKDATAYVKQLINIKPGNTICYTGTGSGEIAAATVVSYQTTANGVSYVLLDVKVWQDPS